MDKGRRGDQGVAFGSAIRDVQLGATPRYVDVDSEDTPIESR
jgi:hypothetical protein